MSKPKTWLLAGAALILSAGAAIAAGPAEAEREATADSQAAAKRSDDAERKERREVRIYRGDGHGRHVYVGRGGHAEHLKDILQLRPDQEPALKAFIDATKPAEGAHRDHMVKFDRDETRTTLQRLDDMQARLAEQQAAASRRIAAIRTFYGQLDAKQKKAFDALPMLMMVGPSMGPMMLPHPMKVAHRMPLPPEPPQPPEPPKPPRDGL
ncbi:Spy/CpxP family protein refolding chaperone [Phenylobacterium kunshanense]|uniref:Periplasmic heavy metal sensor n=1 Tax=Phenylobacterium kunshanense TaxID=1445034 RepID=A0A328BLX6_9CAUL|nr:Spy/CpxP family protein refolding chaperone [Phenylobacterium kunshanense]RAK67675.1 hypothetical protein DJ019_07170 [Phenylobacterium kunshanense]